MGFLEPWQDGSSLSTALPSFWSRKMWNSRGRSRKHTAWSSVPEGFPGTSIWGSEASDQFSSRGYAVLGSEEMGHWSEQLLGKVARIDDGHTRYTDIAPFSKPAIHTFQKQKHKVAENAQCTCPWHKTHVVFPYSSIFWKLQTYAE